MDTENDKLPAAAVSRQPCEQRVGDWIQTYTGRQFWPCDPRPEDICIEEDLLPKGLAWITAEGVETQPDLQVMADWAKRHPKHPWAWIVEVNRDVR